MTVTISGTSGITTPSPVVIQGSTSGTVTLVSPAVAGTNTVTFPAGTGTAAVQGASTNIVSGTAVTLTTQTLVDFTGIPSYAKRITVIVSNLSKTGTSFPLVQLGTSGGIVSTGYSAVQHVLNNAGGNSGTSSTAGFITQTNTSADNVSYIMTIVNLTGNTWVSSHVGKRITSYSIMGSGDVTLSGALTQVRITTSSGTDTFDAGSVNIMWE